MKVLNVIAVILIFAGIIGVVTKDVKKRMLGVSLTVIGMLLLFHVQNNAYGFYGGIEAVIFQLPVLILFLVTYGRLCKNNAITKVNELKGFRKNHPWELLLFIIMGAILIGIPGTGTFGAYMIAVKAMLTNEAGFFTYISLLGMTMGIIILALQFFDLWIYMILADTVEIAGVHKALAWIDCILLVIIIGLGIYQNPIMLLISSIYNMVK